jgi:hypothetical protein
MCVAGFGQAIERGLRRPYRPRLKQLGDAIEMPARVRSEAAETSRRRERGFGAWGPDAIKAARPPGLRTAKDLCATSPPTVSKAALSYPVPRFFWSRVFVGVIDRRAVI